MADSVNGFQFRYSGGQSNFRRWNAWRRKMTTSNVYGVVRSSIFSWLTATNHLLLCSAPSANQPLSNAATDSLESPRHIVAFLLYFSLGVQGIQATSCRNKSHLNIDVCFNGPGKLLFLLMWLWIFVMHNSRGGFYGTRFQRNTKLLYGYKKLRIYSGNFNKSVCCCLWNLLFSAILFDFIRSVVRHTK